MGELRPSRWPLASRTRLTGLVALVAVVALASEGPRAAAQQSLYACDAFGALVEITDYDTRPALRWVPRDPGLTVLYAEDIGIRATTGTLFIHSLGGLGLADTFEVDPLTGALLGGTGCFGAVVCGSLDSDHDGQFFGVGHPGYSDARIYRTGGYPFCFDFNGPATIASGGGMAIDRDGSLVSNLLGSTHLVRIDRAAGTAAVLGDPGFALTALEIDTDGALYGLEATGRIHRIDRATFATRLVVELPPTPPHGWIGLTFGVPAGRIDPSIHCAGGASSLGAPATLWPWELPAPPPDRIELRAAALPAHSFALLLLSPAAGPLAGAPAHFCLGGQVHRILPPVDAGAAGAATWLLDLGAIPGLGPVPSGASLYFQAAYRDVDPLGAPTMRFTNGVRTVVL